MDIDIDNYITNSTNDHDNNITTNTDNTYNNTNNDNYQNITTATNDVIPTRCSIHLLTSWVKRT